MMDMLRIAVFCSTVARAAIARSTVSTRTSLKTITVCIVSDDGSARPHVLRAPAFPDASAVVHLLLVTTDNSGLGIDFVDLAPAGSLVGSFLGALGPPDGLFRSLQSSDRAQLVVPSTSLLIRRRLSTDLHLIAWSILSRPARDWGRHLH